MQSKPVDLKYEDIHVGFSAGFDINIDEELISKFSILSGDYNPMHVDDQYAKRSIFGQRIAHGMIAGALFSRLLGMHLPGTRCLYLTQSLVFHAPIYINTYAKVVGTVKQKVDALRTLVISTELKNTNDLDKILVSGEARVKVL